MGISNFSIFDLKWCKQAVDTLPESEMKKVALSNFEILQGYFIERMIDATGVVTVDDNFKKIILFNEVPEGDMWFSMETCTLHMTGVTTEGPTYTLIKSWSINLDEIKARFCNV